MEQFVRNNRGIDDGKDIPRPILESIYLDITQNEILTVVDRDDGGNLFVNPKREGWLEKQGSNAWDSYKCKFFYKKKACNSSIIAMSAPIALLFGQCNQCPQLVLMTW